MAGTAYSAFQAFTSSTAFQLGLRFWRNMRVSPIATYLAYKASGYGDAGVFSGMSISDVVAVWTPYNNNEAPKDVMGREKKSVRRKHQCMHPNCKRFHV